MISGNYKGNPYKISKYSKFIQNTEKINQKLQHKVLSQIKKDQAAHGTYSLNPFAFYPKNIQKTLMTMMQSQRDGDNLASLSVEDSKKF